jgi:LysR family transcriptional activator of nhaA
LIQAESNDMAMLRLLARNSGAVAVLPTVVVRDEIAQGVLAEYTSLPSIHGDFYAITVRRTYTPPALQELLSEFSEEPDATTEAPDDRQAGQG